MTDNRRDALDLQLHDARDREAIAHLEASVAGLRDGLSAIANTTRETLEISRATRGLVQEAQAERVEQGKRLERLEDHVANLDTRVRHVESLALDAEARHTAGGLGRTSAAKPQQRPAVHGAETGAAVGERVLFQLPVTWPRFVVALALAVSLVLLGLGLAKPGDLGMLLMRLF